MSYKLDGSILEVCNCNVLCPCCIGEDADNGSCCAAIAHHFDKGSIDDIEVSGLTVACATFIPGNILQGNWQVAVYIDDRATDVQFEALSSVYRGERGGPLADFAHMYGKIVSIERAPIIFDLQGGKGKLDIGVDIHAELEPYWSPSGAPAVLLGNSISTTPCSPAIISKASAYRMKNPLLKVDLNLTGHNATQGHFNFQA
ncbi:hypothetical protein OKW30_000209 [Paraburkholderia sp. Clong3]|uniref:DUF1326 domain-containing protein n=1 Tax=unclassified Paraburkholderia TaxID=2615204 RepID=UPI00161B90BD|nr:MULTISPECIES: DUF1326 domain-containing protein [unclassified Paraburkholderia]MBB5469232.1 hypothetical protein [Paraburkholderia sp. CI2]MBC8725991.1 DUF1326 domain-containing protein [Paraburkholderia sp. 31.1]MBC8741076.1 DUF1326 domain-containing protein [Paraburkholderia sp. UCT31]